MNYKLKRYLLVIIGFMVVGIAVAFTLKANVGVGAYDAMAKSVSDIIGIEVGTMGIIFNCTCVLGQIIILRKNFRIIQLLQIPLSILLGTIINFVLYQCLLFEMNSFILSLIVFLIATCVAAFGVSIVMLVDEVTFALEGFCMCIADLIHIPFHVTRQAADVISIIVIVIITPLFNIPWSLGVGTILAMLIFGPLLGIFMKMLKPLFLKMDIIKE